MSDGGIASNFPIHFFDALVPSRPTFGLDLAPFSVDAKRDADEAKNVFLPDNNREGFTESWLHFSGVGGFVGGLVNSIQAFLDNMQARAPGFRDRIARIHLDSEEGGLNLAMPADVLARLGARGEAAGNKIIERFVEAKPSGWENHRWVRLRLLLGQLDPLLRHLAKQMNGATLPAQPPSYRWKAGQHQLAERLVADLVNVGNRLATSSIDLEEGAPRPFSELRGRPRV
jgi:hypothetical protein